MQRTLLLVVSLLVILALFLGFGFLKSRYTATVTDTVLKTERVQYCSRTCSSKYLVFGQHETYEDTDSIWFLKFNSSDLYGHLQNGKTYTFTVAGWRLPLLSWYRNIITVKDE